MYRPPLVLLVLIALVLLSATALVPASPAEAAATVGFEGRRSADGLVVFAVRGVRGRQVLDAGVHQRGQPRRRVRVEAVRRAIARGGRLRFRAGVGAGRPVLRLRVDRTRPTPPRRLRATAPAGVVRVDWAAASDDVGVAGYQVRVGSGAWRRVSGSARSYAAAVGSGGQGCEEVLVTALDRALNNSRPATVVVATRDSRSQAPAVGNGASCGESSVGSSLPPRLPPSQGATFYVSPTGSDGNPGTALFPWRTIQKAADTLRPGETAFVRAGLYLENVVITRSGTATAPITIRNQPGERPVVRAGLGGVNSMPVQVRHAAYLRLQGLVLEGATGPSTTNVYISGTAHDIELSECEVRNSTRQGFFSERTTARVHIIGCHFHDNGGAGPLQQDHNIYVEGSHHAIINNLIRNGPNGFGVQIYPSNDHVLVAGNTIANHFRDGIIVGSGGLTTTVDGLIVNNVITHNRLAISTYWGGLPGSGNVARNNLAWGNREGDFTGSGLSYQNNRVGDPAYANTTLGDYRLRDSSAALDVAEPGYVSPVDLLGVSRPQGTGPDLGAYER